MKMKLVIAFVCFFVSSFDSASHVAAIGEDQAKVEGDGILSDEQVLKLKKKKAQVAKEMFDSIGKKDVGPEVYYKASFRLLKSELDLAAGQKEIVACYEGHYQRMRYWSEIYDAWHQSGSSRRENWLAATYFFLEADIWRNEAKQKTKSPLKEIPQ